MIEIEMIYPDEWKVMAKNAHLAVFDEIRNADVDRISFALLGKKNDQLLGYVTARETDAETVYWQFGGAFQGCKGSILVIRTYQAFIDWMKNKYKRITTFVENTNLSYLRLAMSCGFLITGIKNFNNTILIELTLEFKGGI